MKINAHTVSFMLVIFGAINWGLIGMFEFNLVSAIGLPTEVAQLVYILVGLAALYEMVSHPQVCNACAGMISKTSKKSKV